MFNVLIAQPNNSTKKSVGQLKTDFKLGDFKRLFESVYSPSTYGNFENYRFIVEGTDLNVQNETDFNNKKHFLKNGMIVWPLQRCRGGSGDDIQTLTDIIKAELQQEMGRVLKIVDACQICYSDGECVSFCCYKYCVECFINYFNSTKLRLKCSSCQQTARFSQIFKTTEFIQTLEYLDQLRNMSKYIDCQICKCKSMMINETMYAKQQCFMCKRWFCFFCQNDWVEGKMKNEPYTCRNNCTYEMMIVQDRVSFVENPQQQVPNKRICPNCFKASGYGNGCRYNECPHCLHWFCYICLKPKQICLQTRKSGTDCMDTVAQTYDTFPRFFKP